MSKETMKWVFISVLLLTLLWPASAGHLILMGSAVCVWVMLTFRVGRAGKRSGEVGCATVPCKVKFEN